MSDLLVQRGVSDAANEIDMRRREGRRRLTMSASLGMSPVLSVELPQVREECRAPNWDGFGALPVSDFAYDNMYEFLDALPIGTPPPSIAAEPGGSMSAEWRRGPYRVLSVSVSEDRVLHYAAILGRSSSLCGSEQFYGEPPGELLRLIHRVYSC